MKLTYKMSHNLSIYDYFSPIKIKILSYFSLNKKKTHFKTNVLFLVAECAFTGSNFKRPSHAFFWVNPVSQALTLF